MDPFLCHSRNDQPEVAGLVDKIGIAFGLRKRGQESEAIARGLVASAHEAC